MDSVFRPSSGLVLALYVDGIRCSFESLSISYGMKQPPMAMGRVGATHGTLKVVEYPTVVKEKLDKLAIERTSLYAELNSIEQSKASSQGAVDMKVSPSTLTLIKQNYPFLSDAIVNTFPDPRGLLQTKIIGYNHEIKPTDTIKAPLNESIAVAILNKDLAPITALLAKEITVALSQGQVDALYSLILDIGTQAFHNSDLLKLINTSQFDAAANMIKTFILHRGVASAATVARRVTEFNTFKQGTINVAPTNNDAADNALLASALKEREATRKGVVDPRQVNIQKNITDIEAQIATLQKTTKVETTKAATWRNVLPNTKIHILFKDNNWGPHPRFVGYYEGELTSPGFHRSAESRDFQFQSMHITECLDSLILAALEPDSTMKDFVEQTTIKDGIPSELVSSGTVIQDFSPDKLAPVFGINPEDMDVYNFAKYSMNQFLNKIKDSPVRNNYYARAALFHDIQSRIYDPNYDPNTHTFNGTKTKLKWSLLYSYIMTYTFTNLIPRLGNRISYMQMINTVTELFLHEVLINPAPTSSASTVLVKPMNVFTPIPKSNIIFPIHGGEFNHMESYRSKPTRLIQKANPPNGLPGDGALRRYYTNIAPRALSLLYDAWTEEKDPEKKKTMELITEEERKRGIIASYNDLPGMLTALLQLITITDSTGSVVSDVNRVTSAGSGFSDKDSTSTSLSGSLSDTLSPEDLRAAEAKIYFHKQLLLLENPTKFKKYEDLTNTQLTTVAPPFKSSYKYIPNRITIVPIDLIPTLATKPLTVNYSIVNGVISRHGGRDFHVFEEPTGSIPLMIKINAERADLDRDNKQAVFLIGDKTSEDSLLDITYKKESAILEKHLKDMQSYIAGGYHKSVVIATDSKPESYNKVVQLLAIICEMCEIKLDTKENKGNIRTLSDYFGDTVMAATVQRDQEIKKLITRAQDTRKTLVDQSASVISKAVATHTTSTNSTGTSNGYSKTIFEALYRNEGQIKDPWKISHARVQNSNYTFGKTQFDIGQMTQPWKDAGLSQSEVDQLAAIGVRVRKAGNRSVETSAEKTFIAGLEDRFKNNLTKINQIDSAESLALIKNAERQLKDIFGKVDVKFDSPSFFTHLVDISNQWGKAAIDNKKNSVQIMTSGSGSKIINSNGVLAWRGKSADQARRHATIEGLYNGQGGKSLTVDQLLAAIRTGDTTTVDPGSAPTALTDATTPGLGTTTSAVAIPGAVGTNTSIDPKPSGVNIKEIFKYYSQPLCEYYFYYNRYIGNKDTINTVFNPYAIAGFSALIMDSSELNINLFAHVDSITHTASANGSITTSMGMGFIRRADDLGMPEDLKNTAWAVDATTGPVSVAESLKDDVPFFAGEYSEANIDATYDKTIGCERLINGDFLSENLNSNDIVSVYAATRRKMQYCKITDIPDTALQTEYDTLYKNNPSRIAFKWNNGDFPDRISIVRDPQSVVAIKEYTTLFKPGDDGYALIQDDKLFDPGVQALVRNHTSITMLNRAQKG